MSGKIKFLTSSQSNFVGTSLDISDVAILTAPRSGAVITDIVHDNDGALIGTKDEMSFRAVKPTTGGSGSQSLNYDPLSNQSLDDQSTIAKDDSNTVHILVPSTNETIIVTGNQVWFPSPVNVGGSLLPSSAGMMTNPGPRDPHLLTEMAFEKADASYHSNGRETDWGNLPSVLGVGGDEDSGLGNDKGNFAQSAAHTIADLDQNYILDPDIKTIQSAVDQRDFGKALSEIRDIVEPGVAALQPIVTSVTDFLHANADLVAMSDHLGFAMDYTGQAVFLMLDKDIPGAMYKIGQATVAWEKVNQDIKDGTFDRGLAQGHAAALSIAHDVGQGIDKAAFIITEQWFAQQNQ